MNSQDFQIIAKVKELAAGVKQVRHTRIARCWRREEVALSFFPAVIIEPTAVETLWWPEMPTWHYRLVHYSVAVLTRGAIGSRAQTELTAVTDALISDISDDLTLGGLASDGPEAAGKFPGSIAATRIGRTEMGDQPPGSPLAYLIEMASGYFPDAMPTPATYRGLSLFSSGPHAVVPVSVQRRSLDRVFNGLTGVLSLDLGEGPREITQPGRLIASSISALNALEAQIESRIDGTWGAVVDTAGTQFQNCRLESFDRLGPVKQGAQFHRAYSIRYLQLAR
ncbi:MAG: hypothetical protein QGD94_05015 [Planctomycetia bacterium]|nr:hypothetical protein [Planctomycetia bacterium]